ncbi:MAG: hypothetical protein WCC59_15420 [Terriglobales bacterium]
MFLPIRCVAVIGDDLQFWYYATASADSDPMSVRNEQAFGPEPQRL